MGVPAVGGKQVTPSERTEKWRDSKWPARPPTLEVGRRLLMSGLLVASAAFTQGCIEPDLASGPQGAIDAEYAQAAVGGDYDLGEDAHMMELARQVPGFAGFYYEPGSEDRMVVAMRRKDRAGFPAARSAVTGLMAASLGHTAAFVQREVRYSFLELAVERALLRGRIFALPGVVSLAVDEEANRIAIGVTDESAELAVIEVADALGVPHGMLAFEVGVGLAVPAGHTLSDMPEDSSLQAGYQTYVEGIAGRNLCSMGPTAVRGLGGRTWHPPFQYFLTASHCSGIAFKPDTMLWFQPSRLDRPPIGREWFDVDAEDKCWYKRIFRFHCANADAAIIKVVDSLHEGMPRDVDVGEIGRVGRLAHIPSIRRFKVKHTVPTISLTGIRDHTVKHEILDKVGAFGGWTYGRVEKTCKDILTWHANTEGLDTDNDTATVMIKCTDEVDLRARGGDSGGPVFDYYDRGGISLIGIFVALDAVYPGHAFISDFEQLKKHFAGYGGFMDELWFYDPGCPNGRT